MPEKQFFSIQLILRIFVDIFSCFWRKKKWEISNFRKMTTTFELGYQRSGAVVFQRLLKTDSPIANHDKKWLSFDFQTGRQPNSIAGEQKKNSFKAYRTYVTGLASDYC